MFSDLKHEPFEPQNEIIWYRLYRVLQTNDKPAWCSVVISLAVQFHGIEIPSRLQPERRSHCLQDLYFYEYFLDALCSIRLEVLRSQGCTRYFWKLRWNILILIWNILIVHALQGRG
jgi:hypothetical protein